MRGVLRGDTDPLSPGCDFWGDLLRGGFGGVVKAFGSSKSFLSAPLVIGSSCVAVADGCTGRGLGRRDGAVVCVSSIKFSTSLSSSSSPEISGALLDALDFFPFVSVAEE